MTASTFTVVTVGPSGTGVNIAPATQLVTAGSGDVLVFNTDTTNSVYLTEQSAYTSADSGTPRVVPLGPQQSVVFSGDLDVYGVTAPGVSVNLNLYPSATNYTPWVGTTRLVGLGNTAVNTVAVNIPAGSAVPLISKIDVSLYNSYDVNLFAFAITGNSGSALTINLSFVWYDDLASGIPVYQEDWNPLLSASPWSAGPITSENNPLAGSGPMHGKYLTVIASNIGATTNIELQWFNLYGSNRSMPYSQWRSDPATYPAVAISGLSPLSPPLTSDGKANQLGYYANLAPGAGSNFAPLPLYAGPVHVQWSVNTGALSHTPVIVDLGTTLSGSVADNTANNLVWQGTNTINTPDSQTVIFPRSACALMVAPVATSQLSFSAIGQQGY